MGIQALILHITKQAHIMVRVGQSYKIGRCKSNDLVVDEPSLSRCHAKIEWSYGSPLILDCGSTAGTIVDNRTVDRKLLFGKHRVTLGNIRLVAECYSTNKPSNQLPKKTKTESAEALLAEISDSNSVIFIQERVFKDESGLINDNNQLKDYLKQLEMDRRTGTLQLSETLTRVKATLTFANGNILDAKLGVLNDMKALVNIVAFGKSSYEFTRKVDVGARKLRIPPSQLIRDLTTAKSETRRTKKVYADG